jgi:ubiquinone/menaquinone biosynthesis C-methylase UbiE
MLEPQEQIRHWWDADAAVYDHAAGHAMSDPVEAAAWRRALDRTLPPPPAAVLDVGTGTASLALRAAELGFDVTGVDLSEGMLQVGRDKAIAAGVTVDLVHGAAEDPPPGPFDAVMERHLLWTIPRPVEALAAWRRVTRPGGRLVCFEGSWGGEGPFVALADKVSDVAQRLRGLGDHHHASYPEGLDLPLQGLRSPEPYLAAIESAGWTGILLARLRDVEWTEARREPWPLGWLSHRPRYAIVADAPAPR